MDETLIDRIYEAGAVPDLWPGVLDDVSEIAGGIGAVFFTPMTGRWLSTAAVRDMMSDLAESGLAANNERTRRLVARNHPGFLTDQDVFTLDEIPHSPIHRDFFIKRGGGFGAATVILSPSGDTMVIHAERRYADGPVERDAVDALDALRPHLARASLLSSRIELQRITAAAAALEVIGLAGAVIGHAGRLLAANRLFENLVPSVVQDRQSRVSLADKGADHLLAEALAGLGSRRRDQPVRSIPVPAAEGMPPVIVHLVPVRGAANDLFSRASAILVATPVVPKEVPSAAVIQGLFDLTPTEALVARAIGNGRTTAEIAIEFGNSAATVRSQVKAVLAKTGLHRQAELVGLLRGVSIPAGDI